MASHSFISSCTTGTLSLGEVTSITKSGQTRTNRSRSAPTTVVSHSADTLSASSRLFREPDGILHLVPLLTELLHCPPTAWFAAAIQAPGGVLLEAHEHYPKQTFRNRALILTAQGVKPLTVPVRGGASQVKKLATEIEIDYAHRWVLPYWRTLQTAYNRTPYFLYYADPLRAVLESRPVTLWSLNETLLRLLLGWTAPSLPVQRTESWQKVAPPEVLDRRDFYAPGAPPDRMRVPFYAQAFGSGFVAGLSVLDVLFALGPGTGAFLRAAAVPDPPLAPAAAA